MKPLLSAMIPDQLITLDDLSRAGAARRAAINVATALGFDETLTGQVAIVATELATNLARHAVGGALHIAVVRNELQLVAIDRGPGILRMSDALRDGHSTGGSAGSGLGAVLRLATSFDIHTLMGVGTTIFAGFERARTPQRLVVGGTCLPVAGETVCGDAWVMHERPGRALVALIDGLGHGPGAAEAARVGVEVFARHPDLAPAPLIEAMHLAMRATRGAAVGVAELDLGRRVLRFAGVGNIAGTLIADQGTRSVVSHGGIVGSECRKVQEFEYPWFAGTLLVLASDGLQTQWKLDRYAGLVLRHPALVAATLYRDWARGRDDSTVVALREA